MGYLDKPGRNLWQPPQQQQWIPWSLGHLWVTQDSGKQQNHLERERSRRCWGIKWRGGVLNAEGIYTFSLYTVAKEITVSRGTVIIPRPYCFTNIWRVDSTLWFLSEGQHFSFLHRATQAFIHFPFPRNVLEEKYPEASHVPFPSPNNTFTIWSPKCFFLLPEDSWTSAATSGDSRHVRRNNRNRSLDWSASIVLSLLLLHALDFVFWDINSGQPTPGNWLWWC